MYFATRWVNTVGREAAGAGLGSVTDATPPFHHHTSTREFMYPTKSLTVLLSYNKYNNREAVGSYNPTIPTNSSIRHDTSYAKRRLTAEQYEYQ